MKKFHLCTFLAVFSISIQGCKNDDCGQLCFTPPPPFEFELVNKDTKENLFTNGTYDPKDIEVVNTADDTSLDHRFISENDYNILGLNSIGWETEKVNASVQIAGKEIFQLYVDAERVTGCCSHTELNEVKIKMVDFTLNPENGIYTILLKP